MKEAKKHFQRLKMELQELIGMLSVRELIVNHKMTSHYEVVHQQLLRWT
ncbi:hypothetical protein [Bacteriovorax stolpii]|nr:hypothetical protein [Bacteriovorax stolpii]